MPPYLIGPIASLTVEVEDESGRTADGGEAVATLEVVLDAAHGVPVVIKKGSCHISRDLGKFDQA